MLPYEQIAMKELQKWQNEMMRDSSLVNRMAKRMQRKINNLLPEKIHRALTAAIKQMVRAVLFGAKHTTKIPMEDGSLELREAVARERIEFYKKTGAAEGGITGAGGFLLALADFPLLLSLKIKLLYDIASLYGHQVEDYRERLYILYIFQLAFSSQEERKKVFQHIMNWEENKKNLPPDINEFDWRTFQQEYRDYIDLAKLAQFIPVIGAPVGAYVNYRLLRKLGITAINAYRMRWDNLKI